MKFIATWETMLADYQIGKEFAEYDEDNVEQMVDYLKKNTYVKNLKVYLVLKEVEV